MFRFPALFFLLSCLLVSCASTDEGTLEPTPATPAILTTPADIQFIRENRAESRKMSCGTCAASHQEKVYQLGDDRLIAACRVILAKPKNADEVADAFWILGRAKGDRRRFVETALAALTHADSHVRWSAAELLGEIGSRKEGPALVGSLSDKSADVVNSAAKALSIIGGPADLVALDAWLLGTEPDKYGDVLRSPIFREDVTKYRDEMVVRLGEKVRAAAKDKR